MRQWTGAVIVFLGAAMMTVAAVAATQQHVVSYNDTTITNDHGSYSRNDDGTYTVECCGTVQKTDGGFVPLDSPCVRVTGTLSVATFQACVQEWRSQNGY